MSEYTKVLLSIVGVQVDPAGNENTVELMTTGDFSRVGEIATLKCQDAEDDSGAEMRFEMDGRGVTLSHPNGAPSSLYLQKGQPTEMTYDTPLGRMCMRAYPTDVHVEMDNEGGELRLSYDVSLQGHYAGQNHLTVTYWKNIPAPGAAAAE